MFSRPGNNSAVDLTNLINRLANSGTCLLRHKAQLILRLELATSTEEHPAMLKILGNTNFADLWGN
jgi:hypothetical protein